jgi:hypothetical protein
MFKKFHIISLLLLITAAVVAASNYSISYGQSLLIPLSPKNTWESIPGVGITLQCPTGGEKTSIGFLINYGTLRSETSNFKNRFLHSEVFLCYEVFDPCQYFSVEAVISLVNWAVKTNIPSSLDLIKSWENEFGGAAGVAIVIKPMCNLILKIPVKSSVIFCSPEYFYAIDIGLTLGFEFGAGNKK